MRAPTQVATQRLILAPLRLEDARELHEVRGDPEVMKFWDWPHDENPAATESIVKNFYLPAMAKGREFFWTVRLRSDGSFAGVCDLGELGENGSAETGFMLARRCWGIGLGREAVGALVQAARDLELKQIWARVHAGNEGSVRLLLDLGFNESAPLANFEIRPGVRRDCRRFELQLTQTHAEQICRS